MELVHVVLVVVVWVLVVEDVQVCVQVVVLHYELARLALDCTEVLQTLRESSKPGPQDVACRGAKQCLETRAWCFSSW